MLVWKTDPSTGKKYLGLLHTTDMSFTPIQLIGAPATFTSSGLIGNIAFDDDYLYVCVGTDRWKRTSLSNWIA